MDYLGETVSYENQLYSWLSGCLVGKWTTSLGWKPPQLQHCPINGDKMEEGCKRKISKDELENEQEYYITVVYILGVCSTAYLLLNPWILVLLFAVVTKNGSRPIIQLIHK